MTQERLFAVHTIHRNYQVAAHCRLTCSCGWKAQALSEMAANAMEDAHLDRRSTA